jgi:PST family polysaccharide transporter
LETDKSSSYRQIVKSTSIFGGSQLINILIGVIRNKVIAMLLGTAGLGVIGIYQSVIDMIRSITGFGMEMTGVKEIASANASGNSQQIAYTVYVVRKLVQLSAIVGAIVCLVLSYPISFWTFHDTSHSVYIAALSLSVLLTALLQGQLIVLQGLRQISSMAKVLVWGNLVSLVLTIPFYFLWGMDGILPSFVVGSAVYYVFSRKFFNPVYNLLEYLPHKPDISATWQKGKSMFRLGVFLVVGTIINTVTMLLVRVFLTQRMGLESAGLFQSVWSITNIYLMLVLKSMGSDYYPRLCAVSNQRVASSRLINQQTYVSLLVATPIIVGMLLFGMMALALLYSSKFLPAESLLQWQILGTFLKVASWPMAFILLAKDKGLYFIFSEFLFFMVYYGLNYLMFPSYGLDAAGIAYLIAYGIYLVVIFAFSRELIRFNWSKSVWIECLVCCIFVVSAFGIVRCFGGWIFVLFSGFLFLMSCGYSLLQFNKIIPLSQFKDRIFGRKESK